MCKESGIFDDKTNKSEIKQKLAIVIEYSIASEVNSSAGLVRLGEDDFDLYVNERYVVLKSSKYTYSILTHTSVCVNMETCSNKEERELSEILALKRGAVLEEVENGILEQPKLLLGKNEKESLQRLHRILKTKVYSEQG